MVGEGEIVEEHVHEVIDFGDVPIGTTIAKTFAVRNMSDVEAKFTINHQISGTVAMDKVFICKKREHQIKPHSSINVKVRYYLTVFSILTGSTCCKIIPRNRGVTKLVWLWQITPRS